MYGPDPGMRHLSREMFGKGLVHRFPDTDPILAMREDSVFRHGM
jgi:hypothetical protein